MDHEVERVARAEDVGARAPVGVGLVARLLQALEAEGELASAVDEGLLGSRRVGRDDGPLDDLVRVALDQHVVLERRRLALVAVHDEVGGRGLAQHRPLAAGREAGAAAPEEARLVDLRGDVRRRHRQRLAETFVAAGGEVALEGVRVGQAPIREVTIRGASVITSAVAPGGLRRSVSRPAGAGAVAIPGSPTLRSTRFRTPCVGTVSARRPDAKVVGEPVEALGVERAEETVVHLHARRQVAAGQALGLLERELAVVGRLADRDPERGLGVLEHLVGAGEHAGDVRADVDHVAADRLGVQHVVESSPCPGPRPAVQPTSSAMSSIASGVSQPSWAWAR